MRIRRHNEIVTAVIKQRLAEKSPTIMVFLLLIRLLLLVYHCYLRCLVEVEVVTVNGVDSTKVRHISVHVFFYCNGVHGKDNNTSVVIVCTHGMSACYGESCAEVDWA